MLEGKKGWERNEATLRLHGKDKGVVYFHLPFLLMAIRGKKIQSLTKSSRTLPVVLLSLQKDELLSQLLLTSSFLPEKGKQQQQREV